MVYVPMMEYNGSEERIHGEMSTTDWWWEIQVFRALILTPETPLNVLGTIAEYVAPRYNSRACYLCV